MGYLPAKNYMNSHTPCTSYMQHTCSPAPLWLVLSCLIFVSPRVVTDGGDNLFLFFFSFSKVMMDIILRELYNLPADDGLRADYLELLRR